MLFRSPRTAFVMRTATRFQVNLPARNVDCQDTPIDRFRLREPIKERVPVECLSAASRAGHVYFLDMQLFGRLRGPTAEDLMTRELTRTLR